MNTFTIVIEVTSEKIMHVITRTLNELITELKVFNWVEHNDFYFTLYNN